MQQDNTKSPEILERMMETALHPQVDEAAEFERELALQHVVQPQNEELSETQTEVTSYAYGKVPRHKVVSAFIQVAMEKPDFTTKDVVNYMRAHRVGKAAAREAIERHIENQEEYKSFAVARAKEITPPRLTKPWKPPKPKTLLPQRHVLSSEERRIMREARFASESKFAGKIAVAHSFSSEIFTEVQKGFIRSLDINELVASIIPLDDTRYGDIKFPKRPKHPHHRHSLHLLSEDTLRTCGMREQVLTEEERLIFNIMLIFGELGVTPKALTEAGITEPERAMNVFRKKINLNAHGVVSKVSPFNVHVLQTNPQQIVIKDKRTDGSKTLNFTK